MRCIMYIDTLLTIHVAVVAISPVYEVLKSYVNRCSVKIIVDFISYQAPKPEELFADFPVDIKIFL